MIAFRGFMLSALVFLAQPVVQAHAQTVYAIKPDVTITSETILLRDLLDHAGDRGDVAVFRSPPLGRSGTIQVARIMEAASAAGIVAIEPGGVSQVVVTRSARRIEKHEIAAALGQQISGQPVDPADISIALDRDEPALFVEHDAQGRLDITRFTYDARTQRIEAELSIADSRALKLRPAKILAVVSEAIPTAVATRALAKGDTVRNSDFRIERRPRRDLPAGALDPAYANGMLVKVAVAAGAVMREADVAKAIFVDKNGLVDVMYETAGLSLSLRGKALESGSAGEVISVQNVQTKRTLQAVVIAPGKVSVDLLTRPRRETVAQIAPSSAKD